MLVMREVLHTPGDVWVLGHWEERPGTPGYWTQRQVWVAP